MSVVLTFCTLKGRPPLMTEQEAAKSPFILEERREKGLVWSLMFSPGRVELFHVEGNQLAVSLPHCRRALSREIIFPHCWLPALGLALSTSDSWNSLSRGGLTWCSAASCRMHNHHLSGSKQGLIPREPAREGQPCCMHDTQLKSLGRVLQGDMQQFEQQVK